MSKIPNFFIVGAPKSGTSAIHSYLKQHPEIWMSAIKEPQFFGSDINANHFIKNKTQYLALFEGVEKEKIIGESSVWYLYSKSAAKEIKEFCPDAKIVIILRNPVEMIYSLHNQLLYNRTENIKNFEKALAAESYRKIGQKLPSSSTGPLEALFYTDVAKYYEQVKRYFEVFESKNIHCIIYEEFRNNPQKIYQDLLTFLQVSPKHKIEFKVVNPQKKIRNRIAQNFLARPPLYLTKIANFLLETSLKHKIIKYLMMVNINCSSRPKLNQNLRNKLFSIFEEDILNLSNLLNQNLTHIWT